MDFVDMMQMSFEAPLCRRLLFSEVENVLARANILYQIYCFW